MTLFLDSPALLPPFVRGERPVLERVYRHYVRGVFAMACRSLNTHTSSENMASDAGDIVSETFLRAFADTARKAYDGLRPYRPYLMTIGRNVLRKLAMSGRRQVRLDDNDEPYTLDEHTKEPYEHPTIIAATEQFIGTLSEPERSVHRLRYEQGEGQEETAKQLRLSRQQVRTIETKLRNMLRLHLERLRLIETAPITESL